MNMIAITPLLDKNSRSPLYLQLYHYVRKEIETGSLSAEQSLPSIRQLAQHLGISKNTVEAAYGQLVAEGYVASRERGGYRVQPLDELIPPHPADSHVPDANNRARLEKQKKPEFDFRYGDIAFDRFPHSIWRSCMTEALSSNPLDVLGYGDPFGHLGLREEIARYVYQSRGVDCAADQIYICAGTQHAISMLVQLLELQTSVIAMEEPGYDGVKTVFRHLGCALQPIGIAHDGIDVEQLQDAAGRAKAVYVTPSHQFPLGMVMPVQKRLRLLQWAAEHDRFIIEDDYDSEFRYNSAPIPALKALDTHDRVIYTGTFSKSFLPGVRLSYTILPSKLLDQVRRKLGSYSQASSPIIQQAVWIFMKQGHFARHVRRMRRVYQIRHKTLIDAIRNQFGDRARVIGDSSGMHLLLDVPGMGTEQLMELAESSGCRVYSPAKHWNEPKNCPPSYVMIGFGGLSEQQLKDGVKRLKKAWLNL
ncbi:MocR-like pyridoxine biosynthesis transcription factor PdxR [Paenibacillus soyae]|uniref:PLP-dependent aminotransferase family protein n=1 Tax=Paenibacillus soyae TaxID=2969249 RepID=A0A9X2SAK9_9BACL|nr:PLP-dependent aminotransferase family protein [Paenibacillus soyae]MCR2803737.1 PLP-dependent aminotransferase family protein [Paenibacillus soyae]